MTKNNQCIKRVFDLVVSIGGLLVFWPVIVICWCIAAVETKSNGLYSHVRVGKAGGLFSVYKIKTMYSTDVKRSSNTVLCRSDISISGKIFRKFKLDELPQLVNVVMGQMSLVGPRPDVPGYADCLEGKNRRLLALRPGITGLASLKYRNEEVLLSKVKNPQAYNDQVIWPDKVRVNNWYYDHASFSLDMMILFDTVFRTNFSAKHLN